MQTASPALDGNGSTSMVRIQYTTYGVPARPSAVSSTAAHRRSGKASQCSVISRRCGARILKRTFGAILLATLALAASSVPASAAGQSAWYVGLSLPYETIGGDFDGSNTFDSDPPGETLLVPEIDSALGLGLVLGISPVHGVDLELALTHVPHTAKRGGNSRDAIHQSIGLNGRLHFRTKRLLRPHLLGGLAMHRLTVEDGSLAGVSLGDATYLGLGADLGAGVGGYLTRRTFMGVSVVYHLVRYSYGQGQTASGSLSPVPNGGGLGIVVQTLYYF